MQADLLSLSRSSLYYQPRPPSAAEVQLKHRIDEIYTQWPFYGARKIAAQLQREGMVINRKTVGRYMNEMGIAAIYPGPNLSRRNHQEGVYPYLTRARHQRVSQPYLGDRHHLHSSACRLDVPRSAILDWYSRNARQLGTCSDVRVAFCTHSSTTSVGAGSPLDLQ